MAPLLDFAGHAFWANSFYGVTFAAAYHYIRKNLELRRRLAALRRVLGESEMRLREARLHTLHEQLRPETLVKVLQALQKRYTQDPVTGDRLFDALVAFLRVAMPGIRNRPHSEPTGTSLLEGYAGLRNAIDPTVLRWRVAHDAPCATATATPLPRALLAVLDRVDSAIPEGRTIDVMASGSANEYAVQIRAAVEPESFEFRQLIEALEGLDARATECPATGTLLEIVLRVPPVSDCLKPLPDDR